MGEIGISRREFLYDINFWEARHIQRGYRKRHILQYQLQRLTAYSAFYAMRENKSGKLPEDWLPLYFDHDNDYGQNTSPLTDDDCAALQAEMDAANLQLQKQRKSSEV